MLDIARTLNANLGEEVEYGIQLIFFDAEEAFLQWSAQDSVYGSRHLAEKWSVKDKENMSKNEKIALFVLLDLLGNNNIKVYDYFSNTSPLHSEMLSIETKLRSAHLFELFPRTGFFCSVKFLIFSFYRIDSTVASIFSSMKRYNSGVEDDHIPFLRKGVPILYVMPSPFPSVWHSNRDTVANVYRPSVSAMASIIRVFVAQVLHL